MMDGDCSFFFSSRQSCFMTDPQKHCFSLSSGRPLHPAAPPTFTETPPQYVEAKEGGSITLTCTAFGNPKPSVGWLREGNLLVNSAKYKVGQLLLSNYFRRPTLTPNPSQAMVF